MRYTREFQKESSECINGDNMQIIAGKYKGRKLKSLDTIDTRPTLTRIKESMFDMLGESVTNSVVLDLFAGSGALGIEALSRGADKVFFVDINKDAKKVIESNLKNVKEDYEIIINSFENALTMLNKRNIKFDLVLLDPPYKSDFGIKAIEMLDKLHLLSPNALICFESDSKNRLPNVEKSFKIYKVRDYGQKTVIILEYKV